jgi:hypothetical protein
LDLNSLPKKKGVNNNMGIVRKAFCPTKRALAFAKGPISELFFRVRKLFSHTEADPLL